MKLGGLRDEQDIISFSLNKSGGDINAYLPKAPPGMIRTQTSPQATCMTESEADPSLWDKIEGPFNSMGNCENWSTDFCGYWQQTEACWTFMSYGLGAWSGEEIKCSCYRSGQTTEGECAWGCAFTSTLKQECDPVNYTFNYDGETPCAPPEARVVHGPTRHPLFYDQPIVPPDPIQTDSQPFLWYNDLGGCPPSPLDRSCPDGWLPTKEFPCGSSSSSSSEYFYGGEEPTADSSSSSSSSSEDFFDYEDSDSGSSSSSDSSSSSVAEEGGGGGGPVQPIGSSSSSGSGTNCSMFIDCDPINGIAYSDCGLAPPPGYYQYFDCEVCECVSVPISDEGSSSSSSSESSSDSSSYVVIYYSVQPQKTFYSETEFNNELRIACQVVVVGSATNSPDILWEMSSDGGATWIAVMPTPSIGTTTTSVQPGTIDETLILLDIDLSWVGTKFRVTNSEGSVSETSSVFTLTSPFAI